MFCCVVEQEKITDFRKSHDDGVGVLGQAAGASGTGLSFYSHIPRTPSLTRWVGFENKEEPWSQLSAPTALS